MLPARIQYTADEVFAFKRTHVKFLKVLSFKRNDPLTETEKLEAYRRSGDPGMLGSLYEPYMELVFAICYKYLRNEDEAKDAVMQLFEKLLVDLRTHEVVNLKSWLHSVTRNYCLMQLRAKRVFAIVADEDAELASLQAEEPESQEISEANLGLLEKCMESLAREQQLSVQLFYLQDKCYREIAAETGFELNKVKSYIQNGKRNLKICMDKNGSF